VNNYVLGGSTTPSPARPRHGSRFGHGACRCDACPTSVHPARRSSASRLDRWDATRMKLQLLAFAGL
jgi:hypothetical protein